MMREQDGQRATCDAGYGSENWEIRGGGWKGVGGGGLKGGRKKGGGEGGDFFAVLQVFNGDLKFVAAGAGVGEDLRRRAEDEPTRE